MAPKAKQCPVSHPKNPSRKLLKCPGGPEVTERRPFAPICAHLHLVSRWVAGVQRHERRPKAGGWVGQRQLIARGEQVEGVGAAWVAWAPSRRLRASQQVSRLPTGRLLAQTEPRTGLLPLALRAPQLPLRHPIGAPALSHALSSSAARTSGATRAQRVAFGLAHHFRLHQVAGSGARVHVLRLLLEVASPAPRAPLNLVPVPLALVPVSVVDLVLLLVRLLLVLLRRQLAVGAALGV